MTLIVLLKWVAVVVAFALAVVVVALHSIWLDRRRTARREREFREAIKAESVRDRGPSDPRARAEWLLTQCLPTIRTRDHAINHLFYVNPNANHDVRLSSIAAAVFIIRHSSGQTWDNRWK
jgi:hypothetical protein